MTSQIKEKALSSVEDCASAPKFWDDDTKMETWFALFRSRELNPLNYDNKMAFWKDNVQFFCANANICYFTPNQLKTFFIRKGKAPACLLPVLEDMFREGTIQSLVDYENSLSNNTWMGWAVNALVNSPLKWSFKKVTEVMNSSSSVELDENNEYVHLASLKKQSEDLLKCATSRDENKDKIFVYEDLVQVFSQKVAAKVNLKTVKLLVRQLEQESKACVYYENKHYRCHLIKFQDDTHTTPKITESEISIYILQKRETSLIEDVQKLESEKENLQEEVKSFLKQKMRNMAKNTLRKQKEVEKRIMKLMNVLENIQNMLYRVQDSEADSQILESYKVGANALKSKINKCGLNLDNVDHTMDEIEKALDMHNDIQETLGQPVTVPQNEADLENELAELLLHDVPNVPPEPPSPGRKSKDDTKIDFSELPNVPKELFKTEAQKDAERLKN